jgi:outer membrane protein assembly factor BamB
MCCVAVSPAYSGITASSKHRIVYTGSDEGGVFAIQALTGALIWNVNVLGAVRWPVLPTVDQDTVMYGTSNGLVAAVDAKTGSERWRFQVLLV